MKHELEEILTSRQDMEGYCSEVHEELESLKNEHQTLLTEVEYYKEQLEIVNNKVLDQSKNIQDLNIENNSMIRMTDKLKKENEMFRNNNTEFMHTHQEVDVKKNELEYELNSV